MGGYGGCIILCLAFAIPEAIYSNKQWRVLSFLSLGVFKNALYFQYVLSCLLWPFNLSVKFLLSGKHCSLQKQTKAQTIDFCPFRGHSPSSKCTDFKTEIIRQMHESLASLETPAGWIQNVSTVFYLEVQKLIFHKSGAPSCSLKSS